MAVSAMAVSTVSVPAVPAVSAMAAVAVVSTAVSAVSTMSAVTVSTMSVSAVSAAAQVGEVLLVGGVARARLRGEPGQLVSQVGLLLRERAGEFPDVHRVVAALPRGARPRAAQGGGAPGSERRGAPARLVVTLEGLQVVGRTALGAVLADLPLEPGQAILRHFRLGVRLPVVPAAPVAVRRVVPLQVPDRLVVHTLLGCIMPGVVPPLARGVQVRVRPHAVEAVPTGCRAPQRRAARGRMSMSRRRLRS
mmetsp:Transcript_20446/g.48506  ORF Transcript_20446/g.48506 Transcript_20446/m.48506 type:complete len:250 (+) Transcript_20446:961-1710(+)